MNVDVNVDVDVSKIPPKIHERIPKAQYIMANQVHADMNAYVPMLTGDVRNQSAIAVDSSHTEYNVPYAGKQFYVEHRSYTRPSTGPRGEQKAKAIHGNP